MNFKQKISRLILPLILCLVIISQTGCTNKAPDPVTKQSFYFDTICQITVYNMKDMSTDNANKAIEGAFKLCAHYEELLSKTKEGSDIYKVNHAEGEPVKVDPDTLQVVKDGIEYGDLSGGKFDITVGQAEDLWEFTSDDPHVPPRDVLARTVEHIDYKNVIIDEEAGTIALKDPESEIDLGGVAKGYIADRIHEYLESSDVTGAIISLGGNIETVGGKPDSSKGAKKGAQKPFSIGIETPYSKETSIVGTTSVTDGTVVTSGVYERYFEYDGKEYHHILDPSTGFPADSDILGVSIKSSAGHSADCDALATICLILGSEEGKKLIDSMDEYEAVFITRDNETIATDGFGFTAAQ